MSFLASTSNGNAKNRLYPFFILLTSFKIETYDLPSDLVMLYPNVPQLSFTSEK